MPTLEESKNGLTAVNLEIGGAGGCGSTALRHPAGQVTGFEPEAQG